MTSGRQAEHQHPANHRIDRAQAEIENGWRRQSFRRRPADGPEQIGMRLGPTCSNWPSAVTTSAASKLSMVRPCLRQGSPPRRPGSAAQAHRAGVAKAGSQAVFAGRAGVLGRPSGRLRPRPCAPPRRSPARSDDRSSTMPPSFSCGRPCCGRRRGRQAPARSRGSGRWPAEHPRRPRLE